MKTMIPSWWRCPVDGLELAGCRCHATVPNWKPTRGQMFEAMAVAEERLSTPAERLLEEVSIGYGFQVPLPEVLWMSRWANTRWIAASKIPAILVELYEKGWLAQLPAVPESLDQAFPLRVKIPIGVLARRNVGPVL